MRQMEGEVAVPPAGAEVDTPAAAPPETAAAVPSAEEEQRQKAAAVQTVVLDVHAAWSAGDLERLMSHYADRVDYYGVEGAAKSFVRNDRARTIDRYPRRSITIEGQATMFEAPDLARVLVTKSWDFSGSGDHWTGRMRGEMLLRERGGQWLIVAEKTAKVFDQRRERI